MLEAGSAKESFYSADAIIHNPISKFITHVNIRFELRRIK